MSYNKFIYLRNDLEELSKVFQDRLDIPVGYVNSTDIFHSGEKTRYLTKARRVVLSLDNIEKCCPIIAKTHPIVGAMTTNQTYAFALAHELVHAHQCYYGRLHMMVSRGVYVKFDNKVHCTIGKVYSELPWEKDANVRAAQLIQEFTQITQ